MLFSELQMRGPLSKTQILKCYARCLKKYQMRIIMFSNHLKIGKKIMQNAFKHGCHMDSSLERYFCYQTKIGLCTRHPLFPITDTPVPLIYPLRSCLHCGLQDPQNTINRLATLGLFPGTLAVDVLLKKCGFVGRNLISEFTHILLGNVIQQWFRYRGVRAVYCQA